MLDPICTYSPLLYSLNRLNKDYTLHSFMAGLDICIACMHACRHMYIKAPAYIEVCQVCRRACIYIYNMYAMYACMHIDAC